LVKQNIKFVSSTIIINTLPPSYASMMGSVPVMPASSFPAPSPPASLVPVIQSQMPSAPTSLQALSPDSPSFIIPPSMPISQASDLSNNEAEVKHTIMPCYINVLTMPSTSPAQLHHSGYITHPSGYY
jgi:hypothetical protein